MNTTPVSLLKRLRDGPRREDWDRLVELYTPLLFYWGRRAGLQEADAADLVQDVLACLVRELPKFCYDEGQSFRGWLRTVTLNRWRELQRRRTVAPLAPDSPALAELSTPDPVDDLAEEDYRRHLARRALALMQAQFQPHVWKACWETAVAGRPADEVAAELGVSPAVVYASTSRVLRRLRQELAGLLD